MTDFKELREALDAVEHSAMAFERCPDAHTGRRLNDARKKLLDRLEAAERDAERYRWLASRAHKNTAHDRYGNGAHWSIGFFAHDGRHTLDAAIDAMKEQQP